MLINVAPPLDSDRDRRAPAALAHALGAQVRDEQSLLRRGEASGRTLRVGVKGAFARAPAGTPKLPPGTPEEEDALTAQPLLVRIRGSDGNGFAGSRDLALNVIPEQGR